MKSDIVLKKMILRHILKSDTPSSVVELLSGTLNAHQIEYLAVVMDNPDYQFLERGDYFKTKWEEEDYGGGTDLDQLHDLGLYKDGYVYGQVKNSDDWGQTLNPYYYNMQCGLFLYNDKLELAILDVKIRTANLIKITKSEIKYFNHAANITSTP